jgi:hypothetical protein
MNITVLIIGLVIIAMMVVPVIIAIKRSNKNKQ